MTLPADSLTLKTLFKEMPDSIVPYLSMNNRLDFIDFMESKMKAEVTNSLGGKSLMTALAEDSISIRLNEACRLDILLLTATHDVDSCRHIIALIRTIGRDNDIQESEAPQYYSVNWKQLAVAPELTEASRSRLRSCVKPANILNFMAEKLNNTK
jgi:hypothetical protein